MASELRKGIHLCRKLYHSCPGSQRTTEHAEGSRMGPSHPVCRLLGTALILFLTLDLRINFWLACYLGSGRNTLGSETLGNFLVREVALVISYRRMPQYTK